MNKPADHVAWVERDSIVYLAPLPDGPPVVLRATAADIWRAIASGTDDVAAEVAALHDADPAAIADDVDAFVADLRARGWLV